MLPAKAGFKFKSKIPDFEPDPREIGFAFHREGTEIGQKGAFCKGLVGIVHEIPGIDVCFKSATYFLRTCSR